MPENIDFSDIQAHGGEDKSRRYQRTFNQQAGADFPRPLKIFSD